jgi:hypothetical protein
MGKQIAKKIIQSRTYMDPDQRPIPDHDYYLTYPITTFDGVKKNDNDDSSNLTDEFELIDQKLALKQNQIPANNSGHIVTYTNEPGVIGTRPVVSSINLDPALRNNINIPTEAAVGALSDSKVNNRDFNTHVSDEIIHTSEYEKTNWNNMTPIGDFNIHTHDKDIHITPNERASWNAKANQSDLNLHINNINNPHSVTAAQINTYTKPEIDTKLLSIQTKFFNYLNIIWDQKLGIAKLVEYDAINWDPNYILGYNERLPDIGDPTGVYFALAPATNYLNNQTNDVIIYIKKPSMVWVEIGRQTLDPGDLVVRYPDTAMFVWMGGRFVELITRNSDSPDDPGGGLNEPMPPYTVKANNTNITTTPQDVKYDDILSKLISMMNPQDMADLIKPHLDIKASGDKDILGKRWIKSNFDSDANSDNVKEAIKTYYFNGIWLLYNHHKGIYYSTGGKYWMPTNVTDASIVYYYEENGLLYALSVLMSDMFDISLSLYYSTDGINWSEYKQNGGYNLMYQNGIWLSGARSYMREAQEGHAITDQYSGFGIRYSEDGINWINSNIASGILQKCYYYNNVWIAIMEYVGSSGQSLMFQVYYSRDGKFWSSGINIPSSDYEISIDVKDNVLFIFNISDTTYYSSDGIQWHNTNHDFGKCICTDDVWVASISYEGLYYSIDAGVSWNSTINTDIQDLDYNNNMWIVATNKNIYYSTDGINWTITNASPGSETYNYFDDIYYGNGTWIVRGYKKLCYSTDGVTWNDSTAIYNATSSLDMIECYGELWLANTSTGFYYSTNGINWTTIGITPSMFSTIYYENNMWLLFDNDNNVIYYSTDGILWSLCSIPEGILQYGIYHKNNMWFVIIMDDDGSDLMHLCQSTDGITWTLTNISANYINIKYVIDKWIVTTYNEIGLVSYYSLDGITWNNGPTTNFNYSSYYPANGMVVSWDNTGIKYSIDGEIFHPTNITDPIKMCWNEGGVWFATKIQISENGNIISVASYYSIDGILWQMMDILIAPSYVMNMGDVAEYYNDGKWIKVNALPIMGGGSDPEYQYYHSTNGIDWDYINLFDIPYNYFKYIYYANNLWVANIYILNDSQDGWYGCTCYSEDGINWVKSNMGVNTSYMIQDEIQCCYYANNIWVAAGMMGIYYSYDGKTWQQTARDNNSIWNFHICYYIEDSHTWICNGRWNDGNATHVNRDTELFYSHDGKTWHYVNEIPFDKIDRIVSYDAHDGVIVAGGVKTVFFSSGNELNYRPKLE